MSVVIVPMGPLYIKKADAKDYFVRSHRNVGWMAVLFVFFLLSMKWLLDVSLATIGYRMENTQVPNFLIYGYCIGALVTAWNFFSTSPDFVALNKRIGKYKSEQMIKTEIIMGGENKLVSLILYVGFVIALFAVVYPTIFSLT